jgi:hypothetical protein
MSDWADEIASDLFYKGLTLKAVAAALRKAKQDGREQAARIADMFEDDEGRIARAIRAIEDYP